MSRVHRVKRRPDQASASTAKKAHSHTLLLRTILGTSPATARDAWEQWLDAAGDPVAHLRQDTTGFRRLLPLLLTAIRRNDLSADSAFQTVLKSAYFREELRDRTYRRILAQVLSTLNTEGIEVILINGAALAHSVYPEPMLRHCHNIDLYCRADHVERVAALLPKLGYRETGRDTGFVGFEHDSGLPVELHRRLLGAYSATRTFAAVYEHTRSLVIDGNPVRILSPEDSLLQICGHGLDAGVAPHPCLACDAWMQIERGPEPDRDRLRERTDRFRLDNDLDRMLAYLSGELGASVADRQTDPVIPGTLTLQKHGIS
jgi:hypothetical protein